MKNERLIAVRNYDADYYVNEFNEIDDNGKIKKYAVEIQNNAGDAIEYTSAFSEEEASMLITDIMTDKIDNMTDKIKNKEKYGNQ